MKILYSNKLGKIIALIQLLIQMRLKCETFSMTLTLIIDYYCIEQSAKYILEVFTSKNTKSAYFDQN